MFLLKHSFNYEPAPQHRKCAQIYTVYQIPRALKLKATKPVVACPQRFSGKDLICKGGSCKGLNHRCVTFLIMDVWNKAGFGELLISRAAVR